MGRSITPTFRIEAKGNIGGFRCLGWNCKTNGRPTQKNVDAYRDSMNRSFQPGGVNFHIAESRGVVPHLSEINVVRQSSGAVVVTSRAPMFEVV